MNFQSGQVHLQHANPGSTNTIVCFKHKPAGFAYVALFVKETLDLMRGLRTDPANPEELEKSRRRSIWNLESFLDDPAAMSAWFGEQELFRVPALIEERARLVASVDISELEHVARRYLVPAGLHVTTVGVLNLDQQRELEDIARSFT